MVTKQEAKVKIYGLVDPISKKIRYIGKTVNTLENRLGGHIKDSMSNSNNHKCRWIAKLHRNGNVPEIIQLDEVPEEDWQLAECAWIYYYRYELGANITNATDGGEGVLYLSEESMERKKIKMKGMNNPMYGKPSPMKGKKHSDYSRKLISEHHRKQYGEDNPMFGRSQSDKCKKAISVAMKEYNSTHGNPMQGKTGELSPNYGKEDSEEVKRHKSEARKRWWANKSTQERSEHGRKGLASMSKEERSEIVRRGWNTRKANMNVK